VGGYGHLVKEKISRPGRHGSRREQLSFALNRLQRRDEAEAVLLNLIESGARAVRLAASSTRLQRPVEDAVKTGKQISLPVISKSNRHVSRGFEADWRDAYPGVNAVTLMELQDRQTTPPAAPPVVRYGVQRKVAKGKPDYWTTLLCRTRCSRKRSCRSAAALSRALLAFARNGNRKRRAQPAPHPRKNARPAELPALGERN